MKYVPILTIMFLSINLFYPLFSEEVQLLTQELTLEDCLKLGLSNNRNLQISRIRLQGSRREEEIRWNKFIPRIISSAGLSRSDNFFSRLPNESPLNFRGSVNLGLSLSPSLVYTLKDIRLAYEKELISYEAARKELLVQIEKEFYYLLAAAISVEKQKTYLDHALARYDQGKYDAEPGIFSQLSILPSQIVVIKLESAYLQTFSDYQQRRSIFCQTLGLPTETKLKLKGDLDYQDYVWDVNFLERFIPKRQDIREKQKRLERLRNQKKLTALGSRSPSLNLNAQWSTSVNDPFRSSSWDRNAWSDSTSLSLNLILPLESFLPGSSASQNIKAADDQIEIAVIELIRSMEQAELDITNLIIKLNYSQVNMKLAKKNHELAQLFVEISEDSYRLENMERQKMEDALQTFFTSEQQFLQSQYQYYSTLIDLRTALGLENLDEFEIKPEN